MTFNAAFPSSPLSRTAMQGDQEVKIAGGLSKQRMSLASSSGSEMKAEAFAPRSQTSVSRGSSQSSPFLLSPLQSSTSPQPAFLSSSPLNTPPSHSPDSITTRSLAASPHSNLRLSPVFRSTPSTAARRRFSEQSFGSGTFLHHSPGPNFGSFVGSYEESLLSGRMSSLPSKPLMFDAELGVLGLGKCKPSLKCPPHVTFSFPAHFYSLEKPSDKEASLSPGTPYVGTIDVEGHYIDALVGSRRQSFSDEVQVHPERPLAMQDAPSFPGYRIPPKGQIQLIIKNPNMTAVKLFLVPYDFTDMPAGTKTFIRQKSHVVSPGPGQVSSTSPLLSTYRSPEQSASGSAGRETLRYAIHLHFCALPSARSSKGRQSEPGFNPGGLDRLHHRRKSEENESKSKRQSTCIYLHRQIRVVFDARAPDRSEKLRVVTDTPAGSDESRQHIYSTYTGPSDDWKEAKRIRRAEAAQSPLMEEGGLGIEREAENMRREVLEEATFHDGIVNSDPDGEKWFAESTTPDFDAMDIPLTSRSPWREPEQDMEKSNDDLTSISAPATVTSFPSAAFNEGSSSRAASTTVSAAIQRSTSPEEERADEDRVLLEQWHAALHLRSQPGRPSPPATPTARKPTSPLYAKRPMSPNGFFSLMNRSTSSIGSNGSSGGSVGRSHTHSAVEARKGLRSGSSQRRADGQMAAPLQASLDLDPVSGVMSAPSHAKKPSLIQHWSSQQVQTTASSSGRASPASP